MRPDLWISPAPAIFIPDVQTDAGIELNLAAREASPYRDWPAPRWAALSSQVRAALLGGTHAGTDATGGVHWRAAREAGAATVWLALAAPPGDPVIEARAALAVAVAGFGIWQVDLDTGERFWDDQMYRLRGFERATAPDIETIRALTDHAGSSETLRASVADIVARLRSGELQEDHDFGVIEFQIRRADGQLRWLSSHAALLRQPGAHPIFTGLHWDITERKLATETLRREELDAELDVARRRFLADVTHEIRTPMNAILGMAHLALRTELDARQAGYVHKIERSAKALLRLINDLLDLTKIDAHKMLLERAPFDLEEVLEDVANAVVLGTATRAAELVFDLDLPLPCRLVGDALRVGQVLINLLANSLKFTAAGQVVLTIEPAGRAAGDPPAGALRLGFSIVDSGAGMTGAQLARLFLPFEQADASTPREHGGTGLGLAISQRLVSAMGGRIEVQSEPGRGTRIAFELLLEAADAPAAAAPRLGGRRALIVEAHAAARAALQRLCAAQGMDAQGAQDGAAARGAVVDAIAANRPFDRVVIDAALPDIAPVALALQLVEGGVAHDAIVFSGTLAQHEEVTSQARRAGFTAAPLLPKPLLPSVAVDALAGVARAAAAPARDAPAAGAADLAGSRVLLVDDNEINQELARELLEQAGMRVTSAANGREALAALDAARFDLVLMDCQMPVMDGYEATRAIRARPAWRELPVIAMTASALTADLALAFDAGMNDHIAKPIDIAAMFAVIRNWLRAAP